MHLKSVCAWWTVQAWLAGTAEPLCRKRAGRQAAPTSYPLPRRVYYKPCLFTAALYEGSPLFAPLYLHRLSHHPWLLLQRKASLIYQFIWKGLFKPRGACVVPGACSACPSPTHCPARWAPPLPLAALSLCAAPVPPPQRVPLVSSWAMRCAGLVPLTGTLCGLGQEGTVFEAGVSPCEGGPCCLAWFRCMCFSADARPWSGGLAPKRDARAAGCPFSNGCGPSLAPT